MQICGWTTERGQGEEGVAGGLIGKCPWWGPYTSVGINTSEPQAVDRVLSSPQRDPPLT